MSITDEQSKKTTDLVAAYDASVERLERAQAALNKARHDMENAKHDLATFLMPADAKNAETFQIWLRRRDGAGVERDGLLCITTPASRQENDFIVYWRS